jgi:hypothetical protein
MERVNASSMQRAACSTSGRIALAPPPVQRPSLATTRARRVLKRELTAVRAAADGATAFPK